MSKIDIKVVLVQGVVLAVIINGVYHSSFPNDLSGLDRHLSNFGGVMNIQSGTAAMSAFSFPLYASVVDSDAFDS